MLNGTDSFVLHVDSDENGTAPMRICLKERFKSVFSLLKDTKLSVNDFSDTYFSMFAYPLKDSIELSGSTLEELAEEFGYNIQNGFISFPPKSILKNGLKTNGVVNLNRSKSVGPSPSSVKYERRIDPIVPYKRQILVSTFHTLEQLDGLMISQCLFSKFGLPEAVNKNVERLKLVNATPLQSLMISQFFSSSEKDFVIESPRFEGITTALAVALVTIVSDLKAANESKSKDMPMAPVAIVLYESPVKASYARKTFQDIANGTDVKCALFRDVFDTEKQTECDIFIATPEVLRSCFPKGQSKLKKENLKIVCLDNGDYIMKNYGIQATGDLMNFLDPGHAYMKIFTADRLYDTRRQELLRCLRKSTVYLRSKHDLP